MYYSIDKMDRAGFKWTVNEILSLQREFELLGWSIDQIAIKHKRTPNAIMYKLDQEGFADYNVLYSNYHNINSKMQIKKTPSLSLNYDYDTEIEDSDVDDDKNDEDYVDNPDEDDDDDEDEDEDQIANLSERVSALEESVSEIRDFIKQTMAKQFTNSKQSLSKLEQ
jgi:hypothetical protein